MMILLTGGSKCGKSSLAEQFLDSFSNQKFYVATMMPYGKDAEEAIKRHRKIREGKGFFTIECYEGLAGLQLPDRCAVLLECLGNLCANEMFQETGIVEPVHSVARGLLHLKSHTEQLVVVTNEVGSDGIAYTPETMKYIRNLAKINAIAAELADTVIECVAGIPVLLKGEKMCCIR